MKTTLSKFTSSQDLENNNWIILDSLGNINPDKAGVFESSFFLRGG